MKWWPNEKLGQVGVDSNFAQKHSSSLWEDIYGHIGRQSDEKLTNSEIISN